MNTLQKTRLDPFTLSYIKAGLFLADQEEDMKGVTIADIPPPELQKITEQCLTFQFFQADLFEGHESQAGTDYFLSRNGHGSGYFDRPEVYGSDDTCQHLQEAARRTGPADFYRGDDGLVYNFPHKP